MFTSLMKDTCLSVSLSVCLSTCVSGCVILCVAVDRSQSVPLFVHVSLCLSLYTFNTVTCVKIK